MAKVTKVAAPLTDFNKWSNALKDQESTLQERVAHLKEEIAEAEKALTHTSQELNSLQMQYRAKKDEAVAIRDQLFYLYKLHSTMK